VCIRTHRLDRQLISRARFAAPGDVVAWFGAMQAQDYLAALWALGLRTPKATEATIEAVIADGSVIRTHLVRGTWQYVARQDVRWMLGLVGPRVIASWGSRFRELELDDRLLKRCGELFAKALTGGRQLTRQEMGAVLARGRVPGVNRRLSHILGYAELAGVIGSGGRRGRQQTFALLNDRVPKFRVMAREEALAELAGRYFQSRGPATVPDFAWWSGLTLSDAREALDIAKAKLDSRRVDGVTYWLVDDKIVSRRSPSAHLLPAFDEYLVGYRDRSALIDPAYVRKVNAGGGMLSPAVLIDGRVVGTWRRTLARKAVAIAVRPFGRLTGRERDAVAATGDRYGEFLGMGARVSM
jgi:Winged helix DNA-binding domain